MQRLIGILVLLSLCQVQADVTVGKIFASNMVVQRETQAPFWGTADPGEKISVSASWGVQGETSANADGKWKVALKTPEAGGPFTITIKGKNTVKLDNVLSGEVWLCSGQSNMQMSVRSSKNAKEEIANANYPKIRLFTVHCKTAVEPVDELINITSWAECSPKNVGGFSAAGYFFGRELHTDLGVPIGLINSSWGGTGIEAWTPWWAQKDDPAAQKIRDSWDKRDAAYTPEKEQAQYEKKMETYKVNHQKWVDGGKKGRAPRKPRKEGQPRKNRNYPTNLYNAMIHPMATFAIRGAIWYQGEHNAGQGTHYEVMLTNLIKSWRKVWNEDFPFYFVQLPNFTAPWKTPVQDSSWARIREGFALAAKNIAKADMAITIDIGEEKDIHPKNKQEVGRRLALLALHDIYGKTEGPWRGPIAEGCRFEGNKAIVKFNTGGAPLAMRGEKLYGFALTGMDGISRHADAIIQGDDTVVVTSADVPAPKVIHYAWASNPVGVNLINKGNIPASPFRFGEIPALDTFAENLPEEAKKYELVYGFDPLKGRLTNGRTSFVYDIDKSATLKGAFQKVAYYLAIQDRNGKLSYAFVSMDPFTDDLAKIGVPTKGSGARFQQKVSGVSVKSNVESIATGDFPEGCNIEFWDCNYGGANKLGLPGANPSVNDFSDQMSVDKSPGYGCMQIHNWQKKQSIICFNRFGAGKSNDLGIGNAPGKQPDWTFTSSGRNLARAEFKVLILR